MESGVTFVDVTGSTNTDLMLAGKHGAPHGYALAAKRQTAGRGRRGHTWDSTEGNLLLSLVLRPSVTSAQLSGLAAVSGLAALHELERHGFADEIQLKWPNDLVARGRKLGGILVESAHDVDGNLFAVCGIGLNVTYTPPTVPEAGLAAISLADLDSRIPPVSNLVADMRRAIVDAADSWAQALSSMPCDTAPLEPIRQSFCEHLCWLGQKVHAISPAGTILATGTFIAVDVHGRAIVDTGDRTHALHFEEASLRPVSSL